MKNRKSVRLIVGISLFVGILHFLIGPAYQGPFRIFMTGYLMDILLPMNVYLLGILSLRKVLSVKSSRILAALITLLIGITVEGLQYFGIPILGRTFDPWDMAMYAIGTSLGLVIDLFGLDYWEKSS